MSIEQQKAISNCRLFPPNHELLKTFYMSLNIPREIETTIQTNEVIKCPICDSIMLTQELICPICCPTKFYSVRESTFFSFYRVPHKTKDNVSNLVFLIFDINIDLKTLLSFEHELSSDIKKDNKYNPLLEMNYIITFLSNKPLVCQYQNDYDEISISDLSCIKKIDSCIKPIDFHLKSMKLLFKLTKKFLVKTDEKKIDLMNILNNIKDFPVSIQDIVYFSKGELQSNFVPPDNLPKFHMIQLDKEPSKINIDICIKNEWTYSFQEKITSQSISYFKFVFIKIL